MSQGNSPTQLLSRDGRCRLADSQWGIRSLKGGYWWGVGGGQRKREACTWHQMGTGLASWLFLLSFVPADGTWARPVGKVGGEVKLSISYKNNKLFIMVMHIRGLVSTYTVLIWIFFFHLILFWLVRPFLSPCHASNHKGCWMLTQGTCFLAQPPVWPSRARHSFLLPVIFGIYP